MNIPLNCYRFDAKPNKSSHSESLNWLKGNVCLPAWSRLNGRNIAGHYRAQPFTRLRASDVEIDKRLWSIWGCISPYAPVFSAASRGKQFLACNVIGCMAANLYHLKCWSSDLLDSIVISGDQYHRESFKNIKQKDYEFCIEDLGVKCSLQDITLAVHLEYVAMGKLYCKPTRNQMNLTNALLYFFSRFQYGILQCRKRSLAFGYTRDRDGSFFMFDCQSRDFPLFPQGQGAAYLLRAKDLQYLIYCIVVTLNITCHNVPFTLHRVAFCEEDFTTSMGAEKSKSDSPNENDGSPE